ncbi:MAG TPA: response regulator [Polyangiaceae bacterium]|nr:response regulator [Polyangiaceae bacterium]
MQGLIYRFETLEQLAQALEASAADRDLPVPCRKGVTEGEFVLVTLSAADEATSVVARVREGGRGLRLSFEQRDWELLERFAQGGGRPTLPPPCGTANPEPVRAPAGATALLVDTDASVLSIVRAMLEACDVATQQAHGAEDALNLLRRRHFDLVVVEPALDGMSGLEMCRRLRADRRLAGVPILVLGSHTTDHDLREALCSGADDFVAKPFRAHELRARALGLIQKGRALAASVRPA